MIFASWFTGSWKTGVQWWKPRILNKYKYQTDIEAREWPRILITMHYCMIHLERDIYSIQNKKLRKYNHSALRVETLLWIALCCSPLHAPCSQNRKDLDDRTRSVQKYEYHFFSDQTTCHSSEIQNVRSNYLSREMLQNLLYFIYTKTQSCSFQFSFRVFHL